LKVLQKAQSDHKYLYHLPEFKDHDLRKNFAVFESVPHLKIIFGQVLSIERQNFLSENLELKNST
jgi:hypothetical protein